MYNKDDPTKKFAVKIYSKNNVPEAQIRHFRQELKMQKYEHPYIIKIFDFNENGKCDLPGKETKEVRYAVLELAPNGNLLDYISYNALNEKVTRYYFKQLWEAVDFMHRQGMCHRDLKLENLLLDQNFDLKVSDFGFWTELTNKFGENTLSTWKGTPGYMAPEMMNIGGFNYVTNQKSHKYFNSNGYNGVQSDVFAMGVILFSLLMGRPPFKLADINDPFYRLIFTQQTNEFWKPWDQFASQNSFTICDDFKNLFTSLVAYSPLMRLSINEVLSSKWMNKLEGSVPAFPTSSDVIQYMSQIKHTMEEDEKKMNLWYEETIKSKLQDNKKSSGYENFSSLSDFSQKNDDDYQIMSDLQDIEKELGEREGILGEDSINLDGHDDFEVEDLAKSLEFDLDEDLKEDDCQIKLGEEKDSSEEGQSCQPWIQNNQQSIIDVLNEMLEVDAEVRTTVPDRMLSFLCQYGQMQDWKMVQVSNFVLLKIPHPTFGVVEYALKFDQVDSQQYALKFLKNKTISNELFHSVGCSILELIAPYC